MISLPNLLSKVKTGSLGFRIHEIMTGEHQFEPNQGPAGHFPFEFRVTWGANPLREWVRPSSERFMTNDLEGEVTVGGLCEKTPCKGRLELRYFKEHKIRYLFDFQCNGADYHFEGEKVNIRPWNLLISHTTCYGVLTEKISGVVVSRSVTHFRLRAFPAFLASFRLIY